VSDIMTKLLIDLEPLSSSDLFSATVLERLRSRYCLVERGAESRKRFFASHIADAAYVIGRPTLTRSTLTEAKSLKAVFNFATLMPVETAHDDCNRLGIRLLSPRPAAGRALGEHALALALALSHGIGAPGGSVSDISTSRLLTGRSLGLIGWGSAARGLVDVFRPFDSKVRVFSIRASRRELEKAGTVPASLDGVFNQSDIVIVMTPLRFKGYNEVGPMIDATRIASMREGAMLIVLSRPEILDFDAVNHACAAGRLQAAIDVQPRLELAADDPRRGTSDLIVSERAGSALLGNYRELGEAIADDISRLDAGLLPASCEEMDPGEFGENL